MISNIINGAFYVAMAAAFGLSLGIGGEVIRAILAHYFGGC